MNERVGIRVRGLWLGLAAFTVATATACDLIGPDAVAGPGSIAVELVSPFGSEGAAVFEVTGGGGFGAVMSSGGRAFFDHGQDRTHVVVVLDAPGQIQFEMSTDDVAKVPEVSVVQVAGGDNALRSSLEDYEIRATKVKPRARNGGSS